METTESTKGSRSRSLDIQPDAGGLPSASEPFPSDGRPGSVLAAATTAAAAASTAKTDALSTKTLARYSEPSVLLDRSSDSLPEEPCTGAGFTHKTGHRRLGFEPVYVSRFTQDPCTTNDLSSSPGPVPGSGSGPGHGCGPGCDSGGGTGPGSGPGPATDSGPGPDGGHDPELSPSNLPSFRNLRAELTPNYASWNRCHWEPRKQPWKFLQVSEPGARGQWKTPQVEGNCKVLSETLPRGHCLLYNWEEEGLLTLQLQSPMSFSTTQKDSYQPPRNYYQPIRGKREAMVEMLLRHQICKEVQAEQEPTRNHFEVESVTHHDYRKELVPAGPPAPTKPHDYRQEQPETFWMQRAPQLPGVSNIKTLDTPFRKNCSFSTPVPLSLGQPLPYEPENYSHQLGEISSLACQGEQGGEMRRTTI
ncbi:sperm-associated antigen 8-like isoform X2 [Eumetopias jubatus]|uniref:sperm-associated antigen 8-like isoform X2 n=1 Tax=Eumetopias jubatus TaxID=34886 RepID=UPI0010165A37|nr:sperm-associated antigen 8-like isoform X2 [Eumetopias jubatus]XP_027971052.1 sperm-associated antigen 8-like isoform X2 [Eumetopias jubatus]